MIHHVAIDVPPGDLDAAVAFWELLGFAEVPVPETLSGGWRWVERAGTQIHLRPAERAAGIGWHVAVVVGDHAGVVRALERAGFAVQAGAEHWGEPRGKTTAPGGATVEFMAAPPPGAAAPPTERSSVVVPATTDDRSAPGGAAGTIDGVASPPALDFPPVVQTARWIFRPTALLDRAQRECGDVFTLRFYPGREFTLTCDPADVRRLFTAPPEEVPTATGNSPIAPLVGEHSLLTLNGPEHLRQRKLLLPSFHGDRLRAYADIIDEAANAQLDTWRQGEVMRLQPHMSAITLEVILRAVFGVEDAARQTALRAAIEELLLLTASPRAIGAAIWTVRTGRLVGALKHKARVMDALLYEEIAAHRAQGGLEDRDDILSLMMCARDEDGQAMTDVELRDELVTLLLAGHETTATALSWAVERLLRTPHALARLTDELEEDAYLDAVIHETLRCRPVVPIVGRIPQQPIVFGDYELPAGVFAGASLYGTNHNATVYDDPRAFRPERFLGRKPDTYAWIPFGGGIRRCIGAAFAQAEMRIVLRAILRRARLEAVDPAPERVRRRNITFVPQRGTTVRVRALDRVPARPAPVPAA